MHRPFHKGFPSMGQEWLAMEAEWGAVTKWEGHALLYCLNSNQFCHVKMSHFPFKRWLRKQSPCQASVRIWVWIPRTHGKLAVVAHICTPRKYMGQIVWCMQQETAKDPVANEGGSKGWHARLFSDFYMCGVHSHAHIHTYIKYRIHKSHRQSFLVYSGSTFINSAKENVHILKH